MLRRKDILAFIEQGESLFCEFKRHFSTHDKIAKEIMAFANTKGGYILFGIDDDSTIVGVDSEKGEAELINDVIKNYIEPEVECFLHYFDIDNKEVVVAEIPESKNKPHRLQDYQEDLDIRTAQVYIRVNDKSVQANKEMVRIMRAQVNEQSLKKYNVGQLERQVFTYLEKNETINVKEFSQYANISGRRSSRTLVKMVRANLLFIHTKDNGESYFTLAG